MKQFIQLTISATAAEQEKLIAVLSELHAEGFEEREAELVAYFSSPASDESTIMEVVHGYNYSIEIIEEKNWNEEWEKNFHPVQIGNFCTVRAEFHQKPMGVQHDIIITPKMSFGTGHHATTMMMIEQMQDIDFEQQEVLDFGTGTGVLAILAEKLGAKQVLAIDVDEWSFSNANENITKNNCSRIELQLTSVLPERNFDIVLANINRNVLLQYSQALHKIINTRGLLLLSGIINADEVAIVEAFAEEFHLVRRNEKNGWLCLLLQRTK